MLPSSDPDFIARPAPRGRIRTVLLATDLTPVSDAATMHAIDLAASLNARLLVVNVIDVAGKAADDRAGSRPTRIDQARADRHGPLLGTVAAARARGVEAAFLLWIGEPGQSIVAAAVAEAADLVVVGTRGLDGTDRALLGSVSRYVVYHSACPVTVAR